VVKATIRTAILRAISESMEKDSSIFLIGEGSRVKYSFDQPSILNHFPDRVLTAPVSEGGIVGVALGAALGGMRPLVDLTFNDLALRAMDEIVNHVAKVHFMTGGKLRARMVIKADFNRPENAQSGNRLESFFLHIPGLKVAVPSTPSDAHHLMRAALTGEDPVLFFEDRIVPMREELGAPRRENLPFGTARVVRSGKDLTLVSYGCTLHFSLEAARSLRGRTVEVIDLRTLNPLDIETIGSSVAKTGRLLIVEPDHVRLGVGAEIAALVSEKWFNKLRAPIRRVGTENLLFPAATSLQGYLLPSITKIRDAMLELLPSKAGSTEAGKK
jgi:pyruvate/2-oxoglutarate/acetoin dehydrogenase E1 component